MPGMTDDRRKSAWPWIAALLSAAPLLYVAAFGPACWISSRLDAGLQAVSTAYRPITVLALTEDGDTRLDLWIAWWCDLGSDGAHVWFYDDDGH